MIAVRVEAVADDVHINVEDVVHADLVEAAQRTGIAAAQQFQGFFFAFAGNAQADQLVFDAFFLLGLGDGNVRRPRLFFAGFGFRIGDGAVAAKVERAGQAFQRPAVERVRPLAVTLIDGKQCAQIPFVRLQQGVAVVLEFVNIALQEVDV